MNNEGPFGSYAAAVAAIAALGVLAAWMASLAGIVPTNDTLDAAGWAVLGALFSGATTARVFINGVDRKVNAAHTRLDAVHAPAAPEAEKIISENIEDHHE